MRGNPGDDPELCPFAEEPALHCDHPGPEACSDSGEQEGSGDGGQKEQDGEEVYVSGGEVERPETAGRWEGVRHVTGLRPPKNIAFDQFLTSALLELYPCLNYFYKVIMPHSFISYGYCRSL